MSILLTDEDNILVREHLKVVLSSGIHEVVFKKRDGSVRVLRGTRDPNVIGKELFESYTNPPPRKDGKPRVESTTSLPTFDSEIAEWRSFGFADLISVDGLVVEEILARAIAK